MQLAPRDRRRHRLLLAALVSAQLALACTNNVAVGAPSPLLPLASMTCPEHVARGASFTLDGSASRAPAGNPFVTTVISLVPGEQTSSTLTATFTAPDADVATAKLVVTAKDGRVAEARCRIAVDAVAGEGEGEGAAAGEGEGSAPVDVDLSGSFAMVAYDLPQLSGGSLDPALQCGPAPAIALVGMAQSGAHVDMTMTWCEVSLPDVQILALGVQHTEIPQAVVDALGPLSASVEISGNTFAPAMAELGQADIAGADLADPDGDLPSDSSDPQVTDSDGDGWPGVTIVASGNSEDIVYRRYVRALSGTIVDANNIDGSAPGSFQADSQAALLSNFFSFMVPTGSGLPSSFHMTRVDASFTCDDVRAQADALVAAFPAPTAPDGCTEF